MVFGWRVGSNPVFCLVRWIRRDGMDLHLTPLATVTYGPHVSFSIVFFFFSSAPYLLPLTRCRRSTSSARRATATAGSRLCLRPAPPLVAPGGPHCPAGAPGLPPPRPFFFPTRACCPWLADLHAAGRHTRLCAVLPPLGSGRRGRAAARLAGAPPALLAVPLLGSGRRGRAAARLGRPRLGPPLLPLPRARRCHPLGARPRPRPCSSPRAASPARRSPTAPRRLAPRGLAPSETDARRRRSGSGWSARFGRTTPTRIYAAYISLGLNPTRMNLKPNTGPTGSNPSQPSWTLQPNTALARVHM